MQRARSMFSQAGVVRLPAAMLLMLLLSNTLHRAKSACICGGNSGFISTCDVKFYDKSSCLEYIPIGWNMPTEVAEEATNIAQNLSPDADLAAQKDSVTDLFGAAVSLGFNTVRLFGHGQNGFQLQTGPGQYNDQAWRGFDYLLAQAALHKIKVLFVTVNNWLDESDGGGKLAYLKWAGVQGLTDDHAGSAEDQFWTNEKAMQLVKDHYKVLIQHNNYFSGLQYANDPVVFAWDIFNEPRCPASQDGPSCATLVTSWYNEMAAYLKTIDGNHMVSTGEEGFFGADSGQKDANPMGVPSNIQQGAYWASEIGQDFSGQHASQDMDYGSVHMWPDNWNTLDSSFPAIYLGNHSIAATALGKPFLLQEFGKKAINGIQDRTATFTTTYDTLLDSLKNGESFRGALLWNWNNQDGSPTEGDGTHIHNEDATYQLVQKKVADINAYISGSYNLQMNSAATPAVTRNHTSPTASSTAGR